jgi:hypothetical protein
MEKGTRIVGEWIFFFVSHRGRGPWATPSAL